MRAGSVWSPLLPTEVGIDARFTDFVQKINDDCIKSTNRASEIVLTNVPSIALNLLY